MRAWSRLLLVPLLLATQACESFGPPAGGDAGAEELTRLKERVLELEREGRINEVELGRLRREVADLRERVEGDEPAPAAERRPMATPAPPRASEPNPPPPPVPPAEDLETEDLELPARRAPAPQPGPPAAASRPEASETGGERRVDGDGQALYDRGYTLYHQGSYVDAESAFQTYLQSYASSDLGDNAQFWIGEARLRRDDLSGALAAFRETVSRFPRGNKVPDALFRSGDCLQKLGDLDGARGAWRETIERFPNSAAAALSEERLASVP